MTLIYDLECHPKFQCYSYIRLNRSVISLVTHQNTLSLCFRSIQYVSLAKLNC